jgi:phage protein D
VRAARIGYEVWVEDTKLFFRRRGDSTVVPLACATTDTNVGATVRAFLPRTASPNVVKKVTVRGWNPAKAEEVDADATRPMIPLSQAATSLETPPGTTLDLGFVPALATIESAYGAANGTLAAGAALDLAAEAATDGDAALTAGAVISIEQVGSPFDGKYLVTGVSHRIERGDTEGWRTLLRLVRVDRALFVLPEVGDEVLVAFEQGDPRRPYVIGSLWSSDEPAPPAPFCVRRQD